MTFKDFGLDEKLLEAISYMGFEKPTPIQEAAIPEIVRGRDLIAGAQTGTGKTAAFLLPILNKLAAKEDHDINTLVLVPTRELALQIDQQIHGFAYFLGINSISIYGGGGNADWETEKKSLTGGADIIVATPGKLISHLNMGYVKFDTIEHLVLDEADRMLDIGFFDDIMK
ncbi:MAG: DEAD/DEAH box helicase, partial [Bacteroidales bacterium]|nr:DEAD/DEAH box helicase [Bacteroidales bacterium]